MQLATHPTITPVVANISEPKNPDNIRAKRAVSCCFEQRMRTWVTSTVEEEQVDQALVLAGSLRRSRTCMKLVVIFGAKISKSSRQRLSRDFDLAVQIPRGEEEFDRDDFLSVLMVAFSLSLFRKCVYLSPSMLVLRNCDYMFDEREPVTSQSTARQSLEGFLFTPSVEAHEAIRNRLDGRQTTGPKLNHAQILDILGVHVRGICQLDDGCNNAGIFPGQTGCPTPTFRPGMMMSPSIVNLQEGAHPIGSWMSPGCQHGISDEQGMPGHLDTTGAVSLARQILLEDLGGEGKIVPPPPADRDSGGNEPVAIVGMSFRFPGGNTPQSFWSTLVEGKDAVGGVPPGRWSQKLTGTYWKDDGSVQAGFLPDPVDEFDAKFFGISPKEAAVLDPQQRLLLEVSWEALEDAGIEPGSLHGSQTGVFSGSWTFNYRDLATRAADFDFFRSYMGNSIATGAARISHFLGCTGPSVATESGCSSSIVAVDLAVKSLRARECPVALACGVNLLIRPFHHTTMEGLLSSDYRCKAFDAAANGFARAEGCAVLVLKRLSDALRSGDSIWGLIRGCAVAQEGLSRSLGTPTLHGESLAMELALEDAGLEGAAVSYIEAHGTGTPVGDPLEMAAIAKAYGSPARESPLLIGSVKTNIGHTESVSGLAGIVKVLLSMKHELIPPHLNFQELNPEISLERIPAEIPLVATPWPRLAAAAAGGKRRIAGVSSFGISGTDGHAIIEEPPLLPDEVTPFSGVKRPLHCLQLSAKCPESLDALVSKYEEVLRAGDAAFEDICYSANTGRSSTFPHRALLVASDCGTGAELLREGSFKQAEVKGGAADNASLCFLFTGQGSQYHGMASQLYTSSPLFRLHFDGAAGLLQSKYDIRIREALWGDGSSDAEVSATLVSQTSIFVVEYCLLRLWESWGVRPDYVLGHSLGEFAAAVAAGILGFEDALGLVVERARLIQELPQGKMLVIRGSQRDVDQQLANYKSSSSSSSRRAEFWADTAALNSEDQTVVAGDAELIPEFANYCSSEGRRLKCKILPSTHHAFHSRHMDPMLESYRQVASSLPPPPPPPSYHHSPPSGQEEEAEEVEGLPKYISGLEGTLMDRDRIDADYWVRHTRDKVNFIRACRTAESEGITLFLELGPHPILSALTMANSSPVVRCLPSLRRQASDWSVLLDTLGRLSLSNWKGSINWKGFDAGYARRRVPLPFYQFNRKSYWLEVRRESPSLHPLVGKAVPNPTTTFMYEAELMLARKSVGYVRDHVIGHAAVFPGAAFLEMCLAAGYISVQGLRHEMSSPRRGISLTNLKIVTPLALPDGGASVLVTTVNCDEAKKDGTAAAAAAGDGYPVQVSRHCEEASGDAEWVTHAVAMFHPAATTTTAATQPGPPPIDVDGCRESWSRWDHSIVEFYKRLPEVGLRFGPTFQSLECCWRDESGGAGGPLLLLFKVKVPEHHPPSSYIVHPIVGDAMLQALMILNSESSSSLTTTTTTRRRLVVPVQIGHFAWHGRCSTTAHDDKYIFCFADARGKPEAHLLNSGGELLASMASVDFLETSVKLVENMVQQQSSALPKLWEEVFKPIPGPLQNSLSMRGARLSGGGRLSEQVRMEWGQLTAVSPEEELFHQHLCEMTSYFFLGALWRCGWRPVMGVKFTADELLRLLSLKDKYGSYVRFFLRRLARSGILMEEEEADPARESFWFPREPLTQQELSSRLQVILAHPEQGSREDARLVVEVGRQLDQVLSGSVEPLSILFTEDESKPSAAKLYKHISSCLRDAGLFMGSNILMPILEAALQDKGRAAEGHGVVVVGAAPKLRVLEVGAGTGSFTRILLSCLKRGEGEEEEQFPTEYFFTDISTAGFAKAEREFAARGGSPLTMRFQRFDMEEDPLSQGFIPGYFDVIVAAEVLHVAKDIRRTLRLLRCLLKPGGLLLLLETLTPDPRYTFTFGLLDGYWQFQDTEFRKDHTTLTRALWEEALESADFCNVECFPAYMGVHGLLLSTAGEAVTEEEVDDVLTQIGEPSSSSSSWILFDEGTEVSSQLCRRLAGLSRRVVRFPRPATLDRGYEEGLKEELRALIGTATSDGGSLEGVVYLWGLSGRQDPAHTSLPLLTLCQGLAGLLDEGRPRKVCVVTQGVFPADGSPVQDPFPAALTGIIRSMNNESDRMRLCHLDLSPLEPASAQVEQLFLNMWDEALYSAVFRGPDRLQPKMVACKLPDEYLSLPTGATRFQLVLPSSKLIADLEFGPLEPFQLAASEVEFEVRATALNFRDLFMVLKPTSEFDAFNAVGLDLAGVITRVGSAGSGSEWKVGDRVAAMQTDMSKAVPSHVRMHADLLLPLPEHMTFAEGATLPTVFYTVYRCLVQVARMEGGESLLIHTASGGVGLAAIQLAKQFGVTVFASAGSHRKRTFLRNLGIEHVFDSRSTAFGREILEVTGGRGVDIVLNSLTGPGFKEESLRALGPGGRFVEMSRLNVWRPEQVASLRPDVLYELVDLSAMDGPTLGQLAAVAKTALSLGRLQPLPYQRFDALNIRGALTHLQKAKHIGKIVCIMPDLKRTGVRFLKRTPLCNEQSTYLVTGGLGGIGLEVVKLILGSGGKHVAIASRRPPKPDVQEQIDSWNASGGRHVEWFQADVGNAEEVARLLSQLNGGQSGHEFPPLRGVMHCAGVLADALVGTQSWDKFEHCYRPKLWGSWNLHNATKELHLEHFVLFSSMSSIMGTPGQSNHSSSNSFKDALAHHRRSLGLPATTINWGNWGEVGVATELDFPGISPISTSQGVLALELILRTQRDHMMVLNLDSGSMASRLFPMLKHVLEDRKLFADEDRSARLVNTDEFWSKVDAAASSHGRRGREQEFLSLVKEALRTALNSPPDEPIEDSADFGSLGMDSLMTLELRNSLQTVLGHRLTLSATLLKDSNTPADLATGLVDILEGKQQQQQGESQSELSSEELRNLIREDSILPPHISVTTPEEVRDDSPAKPIEQVSSVLLTGVTGNLGPYFLEELVARPAISKVYCLIRKQGLHHHQHSPDERLKSVLARHGLSSKLNLDKVEVIQGDITRPRLGLSEVLYDGLANEVDAVVHSAALVDYNAKYCTRTTRMANIGGLLRVLEFATKGRLKHVFHASSLVAVCLSVDDSGGLSEDWQDEASFDVGVELNFGYAISKQVCEAKASRGARRALQGIPLPTDWWSQPNWQG